MTHGHELRWGNDGGRVGKGHKEIKRRKEWGSCNSIINEIYLKTHTYICRNERVGVYTPKCV